MKFKSIFLICMLLLDVNAQPIKESFNEGRVDKVHLEKRQLELIAASILAPIALNVASVVTKEVVNQGIKALAEAKEENGGSEEGKEENGDNNPPASQIDKGDSNLLPSLLGGSSGNLLSGLLSGLLK